MSDSIIEVILLVLLVFFVGCILGYLLHRVIAPSRKRLTTPESHASNTEDKPETLKIAELKVPAAAVRTNRSSNGPDNARNPRARITNSQGNGTQPKGLPTPRGGSPDPLQMISGVGPKIESRLHELGIFHFDQIAAWSEEQEQWVDGYLKFKGRIGRDEWVQQARLLAEGREEELASRYGAAEKRGNRSRGSRAPQR